MVAEVKSSGFTGVRHVREGKCCREVIERGHLICILMPFTIAKIADQVRDMSGHLFPDSQEHHLRNIRLKLLLTFFRNRRNSVVKVERTSAAKEHVTPDIFKRAQSG